MGQPISTAAVNPGKPTAIKATPPSSPAALKELSDLIGETEARLLLAGLVRHLRNMGPADELALQIRRVPHGFKAEFHPTERVW